MNVTHEILSAGGASASDALQPGQVHAAQPRARADSRTSARATEVTIAFLGNVVAMNRRPTTLHELCAHQLARAIPTAPDARAFLGRHAPTLPTRACHERHLPRRTRGRHRLAEHLRRVAPKPYDARPSDAGLVLRRNPPR